MSIVTEVSEANIRHRFGWAVMWDETECSKIAKAAVS